MARLVPLCINAIVTKRGFRAGHHMLWMPVYGRQAPLSPGFRHAGLTAAQRLWRGLSKAGNQQVNCGYDFIAPGRGIARDVPNLRSRNGDKLGHDDDMGRLVQRKRDVEFGDQRAPVGLRHHRRTQNIRRFDSKVGLYATNQFRPSFKW